MNWAASPVASRDALWNCSKLKLFINRSVVGKLLTKEKGLFQARSLSLRGIYNADYLICFRENGENSCDRFLSVMLTRKFLTDTISGEVETVIRFIY